MLFNQMDQIINEPTHFPRENIETCIDLILTNQPNLFVHSGVIQSPDLNCKHQIIHGTQSPAHHPTNGNFGVILKPTLTK